MGANHSEHAHNNEPSSHDNHHLQHSDSLHPKHWRGGAEHNKQHEDFKFSREHALPVRDRKCTDVCFLVIFLAFWGVIGGISISSVVSAGGIGRVINGLQLDGTECGVAQPDGPGVERNKLWFYDLSTGSTSAICVATCPGQYSLNDTKTCGEFFFPAMERKKCAHINRERECGCRLLLRGLVLC